jgi:hypothetical protein
MAPSFNIDCAPVQQMAKVYDEVVELPIVADALSHPTAIGTDGNLDAEYLDSLKVMVKELIDDDLPMLFGASIPRLSREADPPQGRRKHEIPGSRRLHRR